jgi:hypothetical protein
MSTIDIDLDAGRVTTPTPRQAKTEPKALPPKPTEAQLYETLTLARNALFCNDRKMAAFHLYTAASVWSNMPYEVQHVVSADLPGIPSALGDWGAADFLVWGVDWIIRNEGAHPVWHLPETGEHCPRRSTLIHDR